MAGQNPAAPKIRLDTSVSITGPVELRISVDSNMIALQNLQDGETTIYSTPVTGHNRGPSMTTPPQTAIDDTYLSPTTPDRKHNLDGATLNSRSGSGQWSDASIRSRANSGFSAASTNTIYSKSSLEYESPENALSPDPGSERDFDVPNNPFAFSPGQLNKLLNPKSLSAFKAFGGLRGLQRGLRTSITAGLSVDEAHLDGQVSFDGASRVHHNKEAADFETVELKRSASRGSIPAPREVAGQYEDRLRVYRDNRLPERKADSVFVLIWRAYNDKILILLTIAAVISLALGIYETVAGDSGVDWVEGVAICVAILIVVTVGAANDYQKERQFIKLNKRKDDREVKVIRSGKSVQISVHDITVGDVLHVEPGDAVPADGIFISGHGVKCDESSATGESDQMK